MKKLMSRSLSALLSLMLIGGLFCNSAAALTPAPVSTTDPLFVQSGTQDVPPPPEPEDRPDLPTTASATTDYISEPVAFWRAQLGLTLRSTDYYPSERKVHYDFGLHDADKIEILLEACYPAYNLETELKALKMYNDLEYCLSRATSYVDQDKSLREVLNPSTLELITDDMSAYTALSIITTRPEYSKEPVKKFVEPYLYQILTGSMVRNAMQTFDKGTYTSYRYWDLPLDALIVAAEDMIQDESYQKFMTAMQPFRGRSHDARSLRQIYTDAQLAEYYTALKTSIPWLQNYAENLDAYSFSVDVPY